MKVTRFDSGEAAASSARGVFLVGGPTGDATSDTALLQAALDAADAAGGGKVVPSGGTYLVNLTDESPQAAQSTALLVYSNTNLHLPAGCTIKLADDQAATGNNPDNAIIRNAGAFATSDFDWHILVDGHGVIDGNAANQANVLTHGVFIGSARRAYVRGVDVKNCRGTSGSPPNETFGVNFYRCMAYGATDVHVFGDDGGDTATGIGSNQCLFGEFKGCMTYDLEHGMGLTHWDSAFVTSTGCFAWSCGGNGFLTEYSSDIVFDGCVAGGLTPDMDRATAPIPKVMPGTPTAGTAVQFGNAQNQASAYDAGGFKIDTGTRITLRGCVSVWNGTVAKPAAGVKFTGVCSDIVIDGGRFYGNGKGFDFSAGDGSAAATARVRATKITSSTVVGPNKGVDGLLANQEFYVALGASTVSTGKMDGFLHGGGTTLPGSTSTFNNPFPFDCRVKLTGGTVTAVVVKSGGPVPSATGVTEATSSPSVVVVPQGGSLAITYSVVPTAWDWERV